MDYLCDCGDFGFWENVFEVDDGEWWVCGENVVFGDDFVVFVYYGC